MKTKCTCKNPIIESNMCEALCTKCNLLIQMEVPQTNNRIIEEWKQRFDKEFSNEDFFSNYEAERVIDFIAELLKQKDNLVEKIKKLKELENYSENDGYCEACNDCINLIEKNKYETTNKNIQHKRKKESTTRSYKNG